MANATPNAKKSFISFHDVLASFVGFLVAIPMSLGIAIASGAPPALGITSAIVGSLLVTVLAGSEMMITGPAAGLIAVTFGAIQTFGLGSLGLIVLLSGVIQLVAGYLKMGQLFRAITPAVIHGMMAGIGLIIFTIHHHTLLYR